MIADPRQKTRSILAGLRFPPGSPEIDHQRAMLDLLETVPDCFLRTAFPAHFTGSALVVSADGQRALFHHHRKLDRWLQFGGHCDGDADLLRVAEREALEESGITGLRRVFSEPFDLDIHAIPAREDEPEHYHYDVRYLLIAPPRAIGAVSSESHELRWLTPEELQASSIDKGLRRLATKWRAWLKARRASLHRMRV